MSRASAILRSWPLLASVLLLGAGVGAWAAPKGAPASQARRISSTALSRLRALDSADRDRLTRRGDAHGVSGVPSGEPNRPLSKEKAEELAVRIERLAAGETPVLDRDSLQKALDMLPSFRSGIEAYAEGGLSEDGAAALRRQMTELQNLEGLAVKGKRRFAVCRPNMSTRLPKGFRPASDSETAGFAPGKTNTGWILDQHMFDPESYKTYPTVISDYKHYDEGRGDLAMGHSDHPDATHMFGWVWEVHSFYWTDITTYTDHATPSYCLFVMVSPDGGFTWWLYEIIYDPTDTTHTTSLDMINPKMAIDITGTGGGGPYDYDRLYIAFEYAYSPTDHDVYVYGETSIMDQPGAPYVIDPQLVAVGGSANWEGNPAIAADYKTGETSYRVAVYEYAYSATDHDLYAAQSTGNGSTWTTAVAVAETAANEINPALTAGCTGGDPYDAYVHLAYNFDASTTGGNMLLYDRGFETGPSETSWYKNCPLSYAIITSGSANTGTYKATLGAHNNDDDVLSQLVTIPSDAAAAHLYFYLRITTNETTHPYDYLYVRVWSSAGPPGTVLSTLATYSDADAATHSSWTLKGPIDLSAYIGQTVRIGFEADTDGSSITSFYVDDVLLSLSMSRIQYARGAHSSGNYPTGLQSFGKLAVLSSAGSPPWPYGAPAIAASHGGSATATGGRVLVAADQLFPADEPNPGDPQRYQLCYAVNTCNGGTGCGNIAGCTPAVSLDWNAYYFPDKGADYRFPSLVVDGVGWVQGTSDVPQNGVAYFPEIFMAYYYRELDAVSDYGGVQMLLADASDETCAGFAGGGAWYYFTSSIKASDDDERVVAKQGTVATFNYFFGWPGICFNKRLNHFGASLNDDVYFTTPGDNYVIDTLASGVHIDGYWTFYGTSYVGPWTYAWPAAFEWTLNAYAEATDNGRYYTFTGWSSGETTTNLIVLSDYCGATGGCPTTSINALYTGGCLVDQPEVAGLHGILDTGKVSLTWDPPAFPGDVGLYTIYRSANPTAAMFYGAIGTSATTSYQDSTATDPLNCYIIVSSCGPFSGPWGHYGQ